MCCTVRSPAKPKVVHFEPTVRIPERRTVPRPAPRPADPEGEESSSRAGQFLRSGTPTLQWAVGPGRPPSRWPWRPPTRACDDPGSGNYPCGRIIVFLTSRLSIKTRSKTVNHPFTSFLTARRGRDSTTLSCRSAAQRDAQKVEQGWRSPPPPHGGDLLLLFLMVEISPPWGCLLNPMIWS